VAFGRQVLSTAAELPATGDSPLLLVALGTLLVGLGLTFLLVRKSP
jgi:LPXTG-motif cell wall-anchored protein